MNLRDHDQPCEHGELPAHYINGTGPGWCLGGREIVIDWEAVEDRLLNIDIAITLLGRTRAARHLLNTALQLTDKDEAVVS